MGRRTEIWNCLHCGVIVERKDMDNHRCKVIKDGHVRVCCEAWKEVFEKLDELQAENKRLQHEVVKTFEAEAENERLKQDKAHFETMARTHKDGTDKITKEYWEVCRKYGTLKQENDTMRIDLCNLELIIVRLTDEKERLKQENEETKRFWYEHLEDEKELGKLRIEQLKRALRKCNEERKYCYDCGSSGTEHTDDCEYVRLCGGAE